MFYSIILAFTLAIDAFAVATSLSLSSIITRKVDYFKVALSFAIFQSIMPIIGMVLIIPLESHQTIVNVLGTVFLVILGVKMIKESMEESPNECTNTNCLSDECENGVCKNTGKSRFLSFKNLIVYSIATSIDALLAGAIVVTLDISVVITISLIGIITFVLSYFGAYYARSFKKGFEKRMEFIGGVILITLALKAIITIFI